MFYATRAGSTEYDIDIEFAVRPFIGERVFDAAQINAKPQFQQSSKLPGDCSPHLRQ